MRTENHESETVEESTIDGPVRMKVFIDGEFVDADTVYSGGHLNRRINVGHHIVHVELVPAEWEITEHGSGFIPGTIDRKL